MDIWIGNWNNKTMFIFFFEKMVFSNSDLHLKRWQEVKSTFCKGSVLQFVRKKVISLTIEKANTISNEYNNKE